MKSRIQKIDWGKIDGRVPAIIQDASSGAVLMLGYMDKEALAKTQRTNVVWFYSRTKKRLWKKGETSGNVLRVKDIQLDCDNDTLLIRVDPSGPVCHTGAASCFKEKSSKTLQELFSIIEKRKKELPKNSYTASLFRAGLDKITLKVAEESMEVVHAAQKQTRKRVIEETVDLLYHLFVLLVEKNIRLDEINKEIAKR